MPIENCHAEKIINAVAAPGLGIWGGHLRGNMHFGGGGKIEFHEISPPPRCQNF